MFAEHYRVIEQLSTGGMGVIYRALDTRMDREVAIKRLLPLDQTALNEEAVASLGREASTLARFQHPNVVTIHSFEKGADGQQYVVMELIDGVNLEEVVKGGAISCEDFENLVLQMLDALVAAQDLRVLHRDIKPDNIMLRWLPSGRIQFKILDFGLAKFNRRPSKQTLDFKGHFLGSVDYIAPEQLDLKKLDQRADLYSLACVLYYAMAQRPPFRASSIAKTIENHQQGRVIPILELRPDLPGPLATWLMGLMSRKPRQRPVHARAALATFEMALTQARSAMTPEVVRVEAGHKKSFFPSKRNARSDTGYLRTNTEPVGFRDSKAG